MGPVIHPQKGGFWKQLLDAFVLPDDPPEQKRICPNCHLQLPTMLANGELTGEVFAIIGPRGAGKSNFFGVLLHMLERHYSTQVGFTLFDQDTFSVQEKRPMPSRILYKQRYGDRLYKPGDPRAVDQTDRAAGNQELRIPLIYRLQFPKRPLHYLTRPLARVSALDLAIFDTAGEDLGDHHVMSQYYRCLLQASGIIFLIDPFQYPGIRAQLTPDLRARLPPLETGATDIVGEVRKLFESHGRVRAGQKISVPVAFALSRSDMLRPFVYKGAYLLRDSQHQGGFDVEGCRRLSQEVVAYLEKWGCAELIAKVDALFSNVSFFALSALGEMPDQQLRLRTVAPLRIADPLLWLLYQRGYIPGKQVIGDW
jgi:hypothetical protein